IVMIMNRWSTTATTHTSSIVSEILSKRPRQNCLALMHLGDHVAWQIPSTDGKGCHGREGHCTSCCCCRCFRSKFRANDRNRSDRRPSSRTCDTSICSNVVQSSFTLNRFTENGILQPIDRHFPYHVRHRSINNLK